MKTKVVCNYAIIRFLPYPETHEFANVGVILMCPELHYLDFKMETKRRDRITGFFPELDVDIFTEGRKNFREEMERVRLIINGKHGPGQFALPTQDEALCTLFKEIVKPREAIFRFSEIGTTLADDPQAKIGELFNFFVERQFAQHETYQETLMTRGLTGTFKTANIRHYQAQRCGNDDYHVILPFVHEVEGKARRAIKPLDLAKKEPTRITEHGDQWFMRVRRLNDMQRLPDDMLFVVRVPKEKETKCFDACNRVCNELQEAGTIIIPYAEKDRIVEFAKAV